MAETNTKFPPSVTAFRMYERTSAKGNRYFRGRWGSCAIALLPTNETDKDGNPIWEMRLSQAPPSQASASSEPPADAKRDHQAPPSRPVSRPASAPGAPGARREVSGDGRTHDDPIPF